MLTLLLAGLAWHLRPKLHQLRRRFTGPALAQSGFDQPFSGLAACGVERWAIKTLSDDRAEDLLNAGPREATIEQLSTSMRPFGTARERAPEERQQYVIEGQITDAKTESDGDLHVVIADGHYRSMVAEFPHPDCVGNASARQEIGAARQQLIEILNSQAARAGRPLSIRVRGVLFFDRYHGQTGGAPNGAELHPVLEIGLQN